MDQTLRAFDRAQADDVLQVELVGALGERLETGRRVGAGGRPTAAEGRLGFGAVREEAVGGLPGAVVPHPFPAERGGEPLVPQEIGAGAPRRFRVRSRREGAAEKRQVELGPVERRLRLLRRAETGDDAAVPPGAGRDLVQRERAAFAGAKRFDEEVRRGERAPLDHLERGAGEEDALGGGADREREAQAFRLESVGRQREAGAEFRSSPVGEERILPQSAADPPFVESRDRDDPERESARPFDRGHEDPSVAVAGTCAFRPEQPLAEVAAYFGQGEGADAGHGRRLCQAVEDRLRAAERRARQVAQDPGPFAPAAAAFSGWRGRLRSGGGAARGVGPGTVRGIGPGLGRSVRRGGGRGVAPGGASVVLLPFALRQRGEPFEERQGVRGEPGQDPLSPGCLVRLFLFRGLFRGVGGRRLALLFEFVGEFFGEEGQATLPSVEAADHARFQDAIFL